MNSAIWLVTALPAWYIGSASTPFAYGLLTLLPAIGVLSAVIGIILGLIARQRSLFWFLALVLGSEALVAIAGLLTGNFTDPFYLKITFLGFMAVQVAAALFLIRRMRQARAAATALSVFCTSYAYFATFVAAMSFTNDWI